MQISTLILSDNDQESNEFKCLHDLNLQISYTKHRPDTPEPNRWASCVSEQRKPEQKQKRNAEILLNNQRRKEKKVIKCKWSLIITKECINDNKENTNSLYKNNISHFTSYLQKMFQKKARTSSSSVYKTSLPLSSHTSAADGALSPHVHAASAGISSSVWPCVLQPHLGFLNTCFCFTLFCHFT